MEIRGWITAVYLWTAALYANDGLEQRCLSCHQTNQIPDTIIYRRYLQTYSSETRMAEAIERYLRRPEQARSIMPKQFFYKFPMKPVHAYNEKTLRSDIEAYLKRFDVKKRLRLKKPTESS